MIFFGFQNEWYQKKKVKKLKLEPNPTVTKRLLVGVNHAMLTSPQTGCDFCITLDMRESVKKRKFCWHVSSFQPFAYFNSFLSSIDTVLRMNQVTCLEMMVLLALTFRKREKNTKIFSFSQDDNSLLPINLTTDMTLEKALTHCETLLVSAKNICLIRNCSSIFDVIFFFSIPPDEDNKTEIVTAIQIRR